MKHFLFISLLLQIIIIHAVRSQNTFPYPASGPIGIGTSSPTALLEVSGGNTWTSSFWKKSVKLGNGGAIQFNSGTQYFGIGGTSPNGLFFFSTNAEDVSAPAEYRMAIRNNGNVGIGTIEPQALLDVNGTFRLGVEGGHGGKAYCIEFSRSGNAQLSGAGPEGLLLGGDATGIDMAVLPNGNVGIGTTFPQSKLAVKGTIFATKVKVTLAPGDWPDYVFQKGYKLLTLQEIENYVLQYKHLPDIPDAREVETNGLDVGEMNKQLLKKIEELTLHMIEMNKEILKLKEKMKD